MSSGVKHSARYFLARFSNALEAVRKDLPSSDTKSYASFYERFQEAFQQQLTTVMAITGAAMAPALNARALDNPSSWEKLVVRLIPRPSSQTIGVGDVVAFNSPFNQHNPNGVMIRRVAALENHVMLSSEDEDLMERVPLGHCWVLADNEQLSPPDVIDSRAFGFLDMSLIRGRVIYRVAGDGDYGPVGNSPVSELIDAPVIDSEVDVEELAAGMPPAEQQQHTKQQPRQSEQQEDQ